MPRRLLTAGLMAGMIAPASAYDFEPVKPLDTKTVDQSLLADIYGTWEVRDKTGKKRCRVELKKEFSIGGYQLDAASGCDKTFPIMGEIVAWRLLEGWSIDLVDGLRKTRVRFATPDNRYVAFGDRSEIADIDEIVKVPEKSGSTRK